MRLNGRKFVWSKNSRRVDPGKAGKLDDWCKVCVLHESLPPIFKAFVWRLNEGTLVTFYQKQKYQIKIIQRYLWHWDGNKRRLGNGPETMGPS